MTLLCLQAEVNTNDIASYPQIKSLVMHETVGAVLTYLNYHMYNVFSVLGVTCYIILLPFAVTE